jgi:hypothetical protein
MSVQRKEFHDFLHEREFPSKGAMPNVEELDLASTTLDYVREFFLEPVTRRVFGVLNEEYEKFDLDIRPKTPPITYADVGALLNFVTNVRYTLNEITERLDAIEAVRRDLSITCEAGRVESEPDYDEYGYPVHRHGQLDRIATAVGAR